MEERTYLIPRKVRTEVAFLGMHKRHMLLVAPWVAAGVLVYYSAPAAGVWVQMGIPAVLVLMGYLVFGWPAGEDDRTAWELLLRWWQHQRKQSRFLYRKESAPCFRTLAVPARVEASPPGSRPSLTASLAPSASTSPVR